MGYITNSNKHNVRVVGC